jgi:hypothetical protein
MATFAVGVVIGLVYFIADLPHDVSADEVLPAIKAKRVTNDRVVEQWIVVPKVEKSTLLAASISADKLQDDWKKIPYSVTKAVIKANKWTREDDAKQKTATGYVALPARYLKSALDSNVIAIDNIIETKGSVPVAELTAALASGTLPSAWTVANYGRVTHGIGIPFMMMGLILLTMCIIIYVIVSMRTPAPTQEELDAMGWRPPFKVLTETKIKSLTDPRVIAIGLIVLMIILYVIMR